jgi:hypothetical protein
MEAITLVAAVIRSLDDFRRSMNQRAAWLDDVIDCYRQIEVTLNDIQQRINQEMNGVVFPVPEGHNLYAVSYHLDHLNNYLQVLLRHIQTLKSMNTTTWMRALLAQRPTDVHREAIESTIQRVFRTFQFLNSSTAWARQ